MTYELNGDTKTYSLPVSQDEGELRQVIVVAPPGSSVTTNEYEFLLTIDESTEIFKVNAPFSSDSKAYISFDEILRQGRVDLNTYVGASLLIDCMDLGASGEVPISASGDIEVQLN